MLLPLLASLTPAHADTLVVLRGSAERWADPAIGTVYQRGGLMGGVGVYVDLFGPIGVDVDVAYKRLDAASGAEDQSFELLPITLTGTFTFPTEEGPVDPFVGLGFSLATFAEKSVPDATGLAVIRGTRPAIEVRAGIRFDAGLVQPSMTGTQAIKGVDVEIFGGRRIEMPGGEGFDLAAWRGVIGLALRL